MTVTSASVSRAETARAPSDLLRDADVALYQAKAAGKGCYEIFDSAMQTDHQPAQRPRVRPPLGPRPATSTGSSTSRSTDLDDLSIDRRRGAAALGPPDPGRDLPRRVHPDPRGDRSHRGRRAMGAARGLPPHGLVARGWRRPGSRSPSTSRCASSSTTAIVGRHPRGAAAQRPGPGRARSSRSPRAPHAQRRRGRRASGCTPSRRWACGSPSTTSGPATPPWPTCASSRSTASRSTGCSPRAVNGSAGVAGTGRHPGPAGPGAWGSPPSRKAWRTPRRWTSCASAEVDQAQGFLLARPLEPHVLEAEYLAPGRLSVQVVPWLSRARRTAPARVHGPCARATRAAGFVSLAAHVLEGARRQPRRDRDPRVPGRLRGGRPDGGGVPARGPLVGAPAQGGRGLRDR